MKNITLLLLAGLFASSTYAQQTQSESQVPSALDNLEVVIEAEVATTRDDDFDFNGAESVLYTEIGYALGDNQGLLFGAEASMVNQEDIASESNLEIVELAYFREFEVMGTEVAPHLYVQYNTNAQAREEDNNYGNVYLETKTKTPFTDQFALKTKTIFTQIIARDTQANGEDDLKAEFRLIPEYKVTDAFTFFIETKAKFAFEAGDANSGFQKIAFAPTAGIEISDGVEFEFYAEVEPFQARDGETVAEDFEKETTFGLVGIFSL